MTAKSIVNISSLFFQVFYSQIIWMVILYSHYLPVPVFSIESSDFQIHFFFLSVGLVKTTNCINVLSHDLNVIYAEISTKPRKSTSTLYSMMMLRSWSIFPLT